MYDDHEDIEVHPSYFDEYPRWQPFNLFDPFCRMCGKKATHHKRKPVQGSITRSKHFFRCENGHRWERIINHDWRSNRHD